MAVGSRLPLRESFNKTLTLTVLLIAISQFNFGFDQQGFAATQAMNAFDKHFGVWDEAEQDWVLPPSWLALFNGLNYLGFGFGIIIGSWVSKHFGRRMCVFVMSCWALVAVTIVITSKSRDQILAGRVLNYIYTGMELAVVPIYQSEIAPGPVRGFVVGTYQMSLLVGGLVINAVARGTSTISGNAAWRIPFGLFYIIPTFVAACIWFVPESPRWLAMNDRDQDAISALTRLRKGKFSAEETAAELEAILVVVRDKTEKGTFFDMFRTRSNLKRSVIVVGCNFFLQATGQIFASVYGALFVKSLNTINPFTITLLTAVVNIVSTTAAMFLVDKLGRRFLLIAGGSIQTAALMTMGGLGSVQNPSRGVTSAVIAMMIIFTAGYSFGWAPIVHTLSAELPSLKLRDITYRSASVVNVCIQFAVAFSLPYLLYAPYAALGPKVGFIYGSIAVLSVIFAFFFVPDCSGRPLEQIEWLFASGLPMRKFRTATVPQSELEMEVESGPKANATNIKQVETRA